MPSKISMVSFCIFRKTGECEGAVIPLTLVGRYENVKSFV